MLWLIIIILILWALLYIIGKFLPNTYLSEKSAAFDIAPSRIWTIITNHRRENEWRNDLLEVSKLPNQDQKQVWKEVRRDRKSYVLKTLVSEVPHLLEREMTPTKKLGGHFRFEITPEGEGSRLKITHTAIISSPFSRLKMWLSPSAKHFFVDQYLYDLRQRILHLKEEEEEE